MPEETNEPPRMIREDGPDAPIQPIYTYAGLEHHPGIAKVTGLGSQVVLRIQLYVQLNDGRAMRAAERMPEMWMTPDEVEVLISHLQTALAKNYPGRAPLEGCGGEFGSGSLQ